MQLESTEEQSAIEVAEPPAVSSPDRCPTCGARVAPVAMFDPCPTCGTRAVQPITGREPLAPSYVYAIGAVEHRFPLVSLEKELVQAASRGYSETAGLTDHAVVSQTLKDPASRYLARQMCWVLTVEGFETYLLQPRDSFDLELLLGTLREEPSRTDVDVVIGVRGPVAPPDLCNGLTLPIVFVDQLYSFDTHSLLDSIPRPDTINARDFKNAAQELFDRLTGLADNAGSTDEHRALNYLVVRAPTLYAHTAEQFGRDFSLTAVDARPSPLSRERRIVEVVLSYTNRSTDFTEKSFFRVDVTEEFPFLVTTLSPYYDR